MKKRNLLISAAVVAALGVTGAAIAQTQADPKCHVNVNTDKGDGGMQIKSCDDETSVGFGGPIRDVDRDHPVGKGDAFIPKAGRDAQAVVQGAGHAIENGAHWLGDRLGIH